MAVMKLAPVVDDLSHVDKIDLLCYLIQDVGLGESVKAIQSYAMNGNGPHTAKEEQFLDFLSWIKEKPDEPLDPEEEEENRIMRQESEAYRRMHPELLDKYPGQYVVIHQGELVDWDIDKIALMERVYQNYSKTPVLVRQVLTEVVRTIRMPSSMMRLSQ